MEVENFLDTSKQIAGIENLVDSFQHISLLLLNIYIRVEIDNLSNHFQTESLLLKCVFVLTI